MSSETYNKFNKIIDSCILKFPEIEKIYITGSQKEYHENKVLSDVSDIDILILLSTDGNNHQNNIFSFLAKSSIGLKTIIHPLIISDTDKRIKLEISEYKKLISKGKILYNRHL